MKLTGDTERTLTLTAAQEAALRLILDEYLLAHVYDALPPEIVELDDLLYARANRSADTGRSACGAR